MFSRAAVQASPQWTQVRHMATLKAIAMRLRAVTNIQKITKSMKMVSAAKYAKSERELKPARAYGLGAQAFFEKAEVQSPEKASNVLIIATTSDRGLCGSAHTNISRAIRAAIPEYPPGTDYKIVCIGDKSRAILARTFAPHMLMTFTNIGRRPPTFSDASFIAQGIMDSDYEFDKGDLYYNIFRSVVSFKTSTLPIFTLDQVMNANKISMYDSLDDEVTRSYNEYALANLVYYALKESACSEQSARMTAMDAASKNAGEMIDKLTLSYNRTRQAVITRELIEIISGAAAL